MVLDNCTALTNSYALQLRQSSNCEADYNAENPIVTEAYNGLVAYRPVYSATCLRDGTAANNYCFADAVTNTSSPTSSYIYYLPLGMALPAGSTPTCNTCLAETMAIFAQYATNGTQPLSKTYVAAAQQINLVCGEGFVGASIVVKSNGSRSVDAATGALWAAAIICSTFILTAGWRFGLD